MTIQQIGISSIVIRYKHAIQLPDMFDPEKVKTQMATLGESPDSVYMTLKSRDLVEAAWELLQPILLFEQRQEELQKVYLDVQRKRVAALPRGSC